MLQQRTDLSEFLGSSLFALKYKDYRYGSTGPERGADFSGG